MIDALQFTIMNFNLEYFRVNQADAAVFKGTPLAKLATMMYLAAMTFSISIN